MLADMGESNWREATRMNRHEEWHVTVDGITPLAWHTFCSRYQIKPLYIELNNFNTQLMCAASIDPTNLIREAGINIVRIKHEVSTPVHGEPIVYWECHVKLDGPFHPAFGMASRDLYRANRWYATWRLPVEFDAGKFVEWVRASLPDCKFAGYEYECAILDTNPAIDEGWK